MVRRVGAATPSGQKAAEFGNLLTGLMKSGAGTSNRAKWKDEALASEIGVETATIANWRRGRAWPTPKHYLALLKAFALDRDEIDDQEIIKSMDEALQASRRSAPLPPERFFRFATTFPTSLNPSVSRPVVDEWLDVQVLQRGRGLCVIEASGGSGKTTAIRDWISRRRSKIEGHFEGAFLWSFYRQGQTSEFVSVDAFFDSLSAFLNTKTKTTDSTRVKMQNCLDQIGRRQFLLVVDGIEALQHPPGEELSRVGRFKDSDVQEFFIGLAGCERTVCIVTSRLKLVFGDREIESEVSDLRLGTLTKSEGLAIIRSYGIDGTDDELMAYVEGCRGHPLTLALASNFIRRAYRNRLPTLEEISLNAPGDAPEAVLAERVLEGYLRWLRPAEAALLTICGLFDQPVEGALIYRLVTALISETEFRFDLLQNYRSFHFHLETLKSTGLIFDDDTFTELVDIHPIIRDYLGTLLQKKHLKLWEAANRAMFALLNDTGVGIWSLHRIVFGCRGGIPQRAFDEEYAPHYSKCLGTLPEAVTVSYGGVLHALNSFFEHGSASRLNQSLSIDARLVVLFDAISIVTALRGYADPQLPTLFSSARELAKPNDPMSLRIKYAECRYNRMAGNLDESKVIIDQLIQIGHNTNDKSVLAGSLRNASAYYFYVGNFAESRRCALEGEHVGYESDWTKDKLGFVNNPKIMLSGYAALTAAMLKQPSEVAAAVARMRRACVEDDEVHSRAIAALIEAMLSDFGASGDALSETASRFERLCAEGELTQWLIAANIMRAAARDASSTEFERLVRRWRDTGARLFVPYWCALAGEACERTKDIGGVHNFSARGLAMARSTGEAWVNARLERLARLT